MTGKQVWYPDKSLTMERTSLEQEEGGRGSFCRQPVTLTTRVCSEVRPKKVKKVNSVGAEKATETEPCPDSYPTVESCSGHRSILEYSTITNGYGPSTPEFCGWRDSEVMVLPAPRRSCPTLADGLRSTLHSRLGARTTPSQRQRPVAFEFQHFLATYEHIDHYRTHYCFTTLSLSSLQPGTDDHQPEPVEQDKKSLLKPEVRSLYRGDPILRDLASRLGVGESIKEPKLLHTPKRTPPSIVKKSRPDLAIDLIARNIRMDEDEEDPGTPTAAWESPPVESPSQATPRPASRYKAATPLELPKIPEVSQVPQRRHQRNTSSSIISISKYLRVTSQGESVEGEEESGHTLPHVPTTTSLSTASVTSCEKEIHPPPLDKDTLLSDQPESQVVFKLEKTKMREELFSLDRTQKEKMITNKAHSLGLISRGWSRTPSSKQTLTSYLSHQRMGSHSRPVTRQRDDYPQDSRPATRQRDDHPQGNHSRPVTRQRDDHPQGNHSRPVTRQRDDHPQGSHSRPVTRQRDDHPQDSRPVTRQRDDHPGVIDHSTGQLYQDEKEKQHKERVQRSSKPRPQSRMTGEGREKLDRLKTIYNSSARGKHSKKPVSRCTSRAATRPATRLSDNGLTRRPATRIGISGLACLEENGYWNELPRQRSSQPQRGGRNSSSTRHGSKVKKPKDKFSPASLAVDVSHSQDNHMVTMATRVKNKRTVNETSIAPGATPQQISEHLFRLKRKFEGVLNVQRSTTSNLNS